MHEDIRRVVLSEQAIVDRVGAIAREIASVYADTPGALTLVPVLSGSIIFLADLMRRLPIRTELGPIMVSRYRGATTRPGDPVLLAHPQAELRDRDVLIVDDILDTGGTLRLVQQCVQTDEPRSMRTVVLLRKPDKAPQDASVDFVGFDIEDAFVVGYGLDFGGQYRNLPYVAELKASVYQDMA